MNKKLLFQIEELRKELYKYANKESLVDPEILEISRKLDCLLNKYHKSLPRN